MVPRTRDDLESRRPPFWRGPGTGGRVGLCQVDPADAPILTPTLTSQTMPLPQLEDQFAAPRILAPQAVVLALVVRAAEQASFTVPQSRLVANVDLVKALGGGWDSRDMPRP